MVFGRRGGPVVLREHLLPARPTLTGAFVLANTVAAGHPLGFSIWPRVPGALWLGKVRSRVRVGDTYKVITLTERALEELREHPPALSDRVASRYEGVMATVNAALSFPRPILVVAEVTGVPLQLREVAVPWTMFVQRDENLFAPGFGCYLAVALAESEGRDEVVIVDWRVRESLFTATEDGIRLPPRPRRMMLYAARCEGGSVVYAFAVNAENPQKW